MPKPDLRASSRSLWIEETDQITYLGDLKRLVEEFVDQRQWARFHSPKNLAMAIGTEAGELMDLFRLTCPL